MYILFFFVHMNTTKFKYKLYVNKLLIEIKIKFKYKLNFSLIKK